jgi:hypothetical protein
MKYQPNVYNLYCFYRDGEVMSTNGNGRLGVGQVKKEVNAGEWPIIDPSSFTPNGMYVIDGDTVKYELKRHTPQIGAFSNENTGKLTDNGILEYEGSNSLGSEYNDTMYYCGSLIGGDFIPSDDYKSLWQ